MKDAVKVADELGEVKYLEEVTPKKRKPRQPSKDNPNIEHSKTTKNKNGSTTYFDKEGNSVC